MAKPEKATAVAEQKNNSLVLVQDTVPDYIKQGDSARGSENVTMEDLVIPRLEIVQGLSPAVKRGDPGYIEGAQLGDLNNSVTRQLYGEEMFVVPVHFSVQYLVWQKRTYRDENNKDVNTDGGFFGAFSDEQSAQARADEEGGLAKGVEVIDTPQHLCLSVDRETGAIEEIMVSMPRTKAKISRQWNSIIKLAGGDRFSRVYRIGTEFTKNAKGDFYNFAVKQVGFPSKDLYDTAEKLYEAISAGERKVVMDVSGMDAGEGTAAVDTSTAEM